MQYVRESSKSVDEAVAAVEAAVQRHGFGVLHSYDFKAILNSKGFDMPNECRVLEVCNPRQASAILTSNISMNMMLPCRISVYEEAGKTRIGTIPPTELVKLAPHSHDVATAAKEVEQTVASIIDESV